MLLHGELDKIPREGVLMKTGSALGGDAPGESGAIYQFNFWPGEVVELPERVGHFLVTERLADEVDS